MKLVEKYVGIHKKKQNYYPQFIYRSRINMLGVATHDRERCIVLAPPIYTGYGLLGKQIENTLLTISAIVDTNNFVIESDESYLPPDLNVYGKWIYHFPILKISANDYIIVRNTIMGMTNPNKGSIYRHNGVFIGEHLLSEEFREEIETEVGTTKFLAHSGLKVYTEGKEKVDESCHISLIGNDTSGYIRFFRYNFMSRKFTCPSSDWLALFTMYGKKI